MARNTGNPFFIAQSTSGVTKKGQSGILVFIPVDLP